MRRLLALGLLVLVASGSTCIQSGTSDGGPGKVRNVKNPPPFRFAPVPLEKDAPRLNDQELTALFKIARLDPLNARDTSALRKILKLPDIIFAKFGNYVIVSLYVPGSSETLIGSAAGGNLAFSTAGAARNALGGRGLDFLKRARIRIDVVHTLSPCTNGHRSTMTPGLEGLGTIGNKGQVMLPADRILSDAVGVDPDEMAAYLARTYVFKLGKLAGIPRKDITQSSMMLAKFRSLAAVQLLPNQKPLRLFRGNLLAMPLSANECKNAALRGFQFLLAENLPDGSPAGAYFPLSDVRKTQISSATSTAALTAGIFEWARTIKANGQPLSPKILALCRQASSLLSRLRSKTISDPRRNFCYIPDGNKITLATSALTLMAFCYRELAMGPQVTTKAERTCMKSLSSFLLSQQTPSGEFMNSYDSIKGLPRKTLHRKIGPAEAVLALHLYGQVTASKDPGLANACRRGAIFIAAAEKALLKRTSPGNQRPGAASPYGHMTLQALAVMASQYDHAPSRQTLFELADAVIYSQISVLAPGARTAREATAYPDLLGAIDRGNLPSVYVTAIKARGLAAAAAEAIRVKDTVRAAKYISALKLASRFLAQNQYHRYNSYNLPRPKRANGGFRLSPVCSRIEPAGAQHCAAFLGLWSTIQPR